MSGHLKALIISLFFGIGPAFAATDAPDPLVLDQERKLKDDAENKAQDICDSILGKNRSNVLATVELGIESTRKGGSVLDQKRESSQGLGDENYILPWVPAPKSVSQDEVPKDANVQTQAAQQETIDVKTVLKRFDVTVVHDESIPAPQVEVARGALMSAFNRYKEVLKLEFRAASFQRDAFNPADAVKKNLWDFLKPQHLILLFLLMLAMMLLRFFFGPLADFMRNYIEGMKEQSRSKVEMQNQNENENDTDAQNEEDGNVDGAGEMTPEELAALEAQQLEEAMQKFEPFKYVNDENIKQLAYLLHHEEPWIIAVVISYLSAEHSFKVMEALPADLQAKVALETAMYRQTSLEQVQTIDEDIKQKIDFVVGGMEKLLVILESSDRLSRDNILEYLKNEKPAIYERVRENILLFEDIANFPKPAMQIVVRELKTEQLARALRGASPELQQKFFENMSQGAVTLLKEEMEYGRPVTDDQIEEERRKIIDLIKEMEKDGKISFRQKGKIATPIEGGDTMGSKLGPAPTAADPEAALTAYNEALTATEAGQAEEALAKFEEAVRNDPSMVAAQQGLANAYYAAGRYPEALAAFDTALALEPNPELQAWVDEFRASVSASAA